MKTHVICEQFYVGQKLIDRAVLPDLWTPEDAQARVKMLNSVNIRHQYYVRVPTTEENEEIRRMETSRKESATTWIRR